MKSNKLQATIQVDPNAATRTAVMLYSVVSYLIGVVAVVYLILFIADMLVPITINRGSGIAPEAGTAHTLAWNAGVVLIWGLQHTIMARPTFKRMWTKVVPMPMERSTYLNCVAIATMLLVLLWKPMPNVIWDLSSGVLIALWAVPVLTTGRLVFNVLMTTYVFIGLYFEERTLSAELGSDYVQYKKTTPSVIPRVRKRQCE